MDKKQTRTVSARISIDEFAKALDGLISKGVPEERLVTNSSIIRAAVLMCCLLTDEPKGPPSKESLAKIEQFWKITKRDKNISMDELY